MNKNVYIENTNINKYDNSKEYNPSNDYQEALNISQKSDPNVYAEVRALLMQMGLDKKNQGTERWNPFRDFIKPGNKVVIKPNLVLHINKIGEGEDCLITNFSVIRPLIDYALKALGNSGELIIGDAPVQDCEFNKVIKLFGLEQAINKYNKAGYNIQLKDFRKNQNPEIKCTIVDIGRDSSLCETDQFGKKYAITNYNLREMHKHHNANKHEYMIPNDILESDVIINVPKPKTHRKAGITACLKNFIGANSKKEYLPHHRNGSIKNGGDEYPENDIFKNTESFLKNYTYTNNPIIKPLRKCMRLEMKLTKKNRYVEGSWYGNDTIWRTILDINKIMLYSDKNGQLRNNEQRIILNIADMIVAGEKEGPMLPSRKTTGILIGSFNSLNADSVICKIMGFNINKIKYIANGYKLKKYKLSNGKNYKIYDDNGIVQDITKYSQHFIPADGWIDYLME